MGVVGKAVQQLERIAARAEQLGLNDMLAVVYRQIIQTLKTRPREWGEPDKDYPGLNATGYHKAILPAGLWIEYAVHNVNPAVWISKLVVLEDSPFAGS